MDHDTIVRPDYQLRDSLWAASGAIFLTVFAYNLIGETMRDAIDPYLKKSAK